MIKIADIKTFCLDDLVSRILEIRSFKDGSTEIITAIDIKSGEMFVLKHIRHSEEVQPS